MERPRSSQRARVMSTTLASLWMLVGCGDDAGAAATEGATTSSTGSTDPTSPTGLPTTTGDDTTTTGADGSSTSDASSSSTAAGSSSSTGGDTTSSSESTTGMAAFDVPFTELDTYPLPLTIRVQPGWILITSAAEWDAQTGVPVPAGVSFPEDWLVLGSRGPLPFPGHALEPSALTWDAGTLVVDGSAVDPAADCETYQLTWPADTLLRIDALDVRVSDIDDQTTPVVASCAGGAGQDMSCSLATPCTTGLLCASLIRSTVLSNNPGGLCLPTSYAGVFTGGALAIPSDGTTAETSQLVAGLTSVDMDVVIWVETDHPAPQELVIELRNPSDNQVPVASLQRSPLHPGGVGIVPIGFSGDESVNGTWWLVVRDEVVNANNGSVTGWELEIMSRFD